MGMACGIIGSLSLIVEFTKSIDPLHAFEIIAGVTLFFVLVFLIIIKEPKIERNYEKKSYTQETWQLTKLTF